MKIDKHEKIMKSELQAQLEQFEQQIDLMNQNYEEEI